MSSYLLLILIIYLIILQLGTISCQKSKACGDWVVYKDEKCVKYFKNKGHVAYDSAKAFCQNQNGKLLIINNMEEEKFVANLLFKSYKVVHPVWLGIRRSNGVYRWLTNRDLKFINWERNNPNSKYGDCVKMVAESHPIGKWVTCSCGTKNVVVCEKTQIWTQSDMAKIISGMRIDMKGAYTEIIDDVKAAVSEVKHELNTAVKKLTVIENMHEDKLNYLAKNPVPIGYIYIQYSWQTEPKVIWTMCQWTDISHQYAGMFFRGLGGNSSAFGITQQDNLPEIKIIRSKSDANSLLKDALIQTNIGSQSPPIFTGINYGEMKNYRDSFSEYGLVFVREGGDVRPRNTPIKIWRRTN